MPAARTDEPPSPVNVPRFERFFRTVEGLDVDKSDVKRYEDFLHRKTHDLLLRGQAAAEANGRDIIQPHDLPITKGLQECIHAFRTMDEQIELRPVLEALTQLPRLNLGYSADVEAALPEIEGGLSVALAHAFRILDPKVKNPQTAQWEQAFRMFHLLL